MNYIGFYSGFYPLHATVPFYPIGFFHVRTCKCGRHDYMQKIPQHKNMYNTPSPKLARDAQGRFIKKKDLFSTRGEYYA